MATCEKCSKEIKDSAKFCKWCGAKISREEPVKTTTSQVQTVDVQKIPPANLVLILGIISFCLGVFLLGFYLGMMTLILGIISIRKDNNNKKIITGIVLGFLAIFMAPIAFQSISTTDTVAVTPRPTIISTPRPTPVSTSTPTINPTSKPTPKPTPTPIPKPVATPKPTPVPQPVRTTSQSNAIRKAQSYLDFSAFSRQGLIEQLEYEQFSHEDAVYAVDNISVDWNTQAAKKAQSYLEFSAYSRGGLIEQLEYEGFTNGQATYGVNAVGL